MRIRRWGLALVVLGIFAGSMLAQAQGSPLDAAGDAIDRKDYSSAEKMLSGYLQDHPRDSAAMLMLGTARLGAKDSDGAIAELKVLLKAEPMDWNGHIYLAQAYAQKGDWADFDKERKVMKTARDSHARGIELVGDDDVIDVLHVGGKDYTVQAFYKPRGPHHTSYVFLHYGNDKKLKDLIECDSDDSSQAMFRQQFPAEAERGERRFSLAVFKADGDNLVHQPMLRYYDGEPSYEALRADVLLVIEGKAPVPTALTAPAQKK